VANPRSLAGNQAFASKAGADMATDDLLGVLGDDLLGVLGDDLLGVLGAVRGTGVRAAVADLRTWTAEGIHDVRCMQQRDGSVGVRSREEPEDAAAEVAHSAEYGGGAEAARPVHEEGDGQRKKQEENGAVVDE
jgi:hypothetical protein